MLDDVVGCLACPLCGEDLARRHGSLACANRHSFDIARHGYVNLLPGDARTGTADTAEMVASREAVLADGLFAPLADAVAEAARRGAEAAPGGCVADLGAGTGYYLASLLDRLPGARGIALDISKHAIRRAARAHERAGAFVCDVWGRLPLRTASAAVLLDVFAPRNAPEMRRVLAPDGVLVVATPAPEHLAELVGPLGLLAVDENKAERLEGTLGELFAPAEERLVRYRLPLTREQAVTLARMGPSARHSTAEQLRERASGLADRALVTFSVTVGIYRPL